MLIAAKALLDANPRPDEQAVRTALAGNLCRCTGYGGILRAVLDVATKGTGATPYPTTVGPIPPAS
jgi:aerobic-type carbon monoxide dehydrogenase small subunit (CoxS/CutS family)